MFIGKTKQKKKKKTRECQYMANVRQNVHFNLSFISPRKMYQNKHHLIYYF